MTADVIVVMTKPGPKQEAFVVRGTSIVLLEESIPEISRLTAAKNKNHCRDRHGLFVILYKWLVRLFGVTLSAPAMMLRTVRTRCNSSVMAFATSIQLTVKSLLVFILCCCPDLAANYSHPGHSHTLTCYQSTLLLARLFQKPSKNHVM